MNKEEAKNLIDGTFSNSFDRERFQTFAVNLFNDLNLSKQSSYSGNLIPDKFKEYVSFYERIGQYKDPQGNVIDVLAIHLKKTSSLDRARTTQRNFAADYLERRDKPGKDSVLAAYYHESLPNYRISYVKREYTLEETEEGKVRPQKELTPARRYSFLVGPEEPNHTARRQLLPVLTRTRENPRIRELEEAFSIEKVTEEFFDAYYRLYRRTLDELEKLLEEEQSIKNEFDEKDIRPEDFAKRLLGQIVFLYFLQKKGWFGVDRDKKWGTGPKNFLRQLFEKQYSTYDNFFNDILEPLFYEALAKERDEDYYRLFDCKIPFLNGSLFDPLNDYDWVHTDLLLPDDLFSNDEVTEHGEEGAGILDVFDRYNFTVKEDEPLEKEVAVDPEMLGKVFENLIEENIKKGKGTYYTPRPVVHYMCQESLIDYLDNQFGSIDRDDVEILVTRGKSIVEHDRRVEEKGEETEEYPYRMPESIRDRATDIDRVLAEINICDPAVGSGAFPVGMMKELVNARTALTTYLPNQSSSDEDRSSYSFKRQAIQNSLYGVDIDPGAVEIAKLRLWLSLIVEEESRDRIKPLPNLDYKMMQGDSLVDEYEGIELFDESLIESKEEELQREIEEAEQKQRKLQSKYIELDQSDKKSDTELEEVKNKLEHVNDRIDSLRKKAEARGNQNNLFDRDSHKIFNDLKTLQRKYFNAFRKAEKQELKEDIRQLEWRLIETSLKEQGKEEKIEEVEELKDAQVRPFFLWKLYFADVFRENGGFDIVIANPPWVRQESLGEKKEYFKNHYETYYGTADLYVYFLERGYNLLNREGTFCYITSNKWMRAKYGKNLRTWLREKNIRQIIDFGDYPIFEATTYPSILLLNATSDGERFQAVDFSDVDEEENLLDHLRERIRNDSFEIGKDFLTEQKVTLVNTRKQNLLKKIESTGVHLEEYVDGKIYRGILTGLNEAFVIDEETKEKITSADNKSEERIKPFLKGREIKRYAKLDPDNYVILFPDGWTEQNAPENTNRWNWLQENYPGITEHLRPYEERARDRYDQGEYWWELRACSYYDEFRKPKLMFADIAERGNFTLDNEGSVYCSTTGSIIPNNDPFLLAILNSKLMTFYYANMAVSYRGGYLRYKYMYLKNIPITSSSENQTIETLVDDLMKHEDRTRKIEKRIDQEVFKQYAVGEDEINIIDQFFRD